MADTTINVNKQTVLDLLTGGQKTPFLIPEYQRPYSWNEDHIETLFDDLWEFSEEHSQENGPENYFLGCIVTYKEGGAHQVIDGQQRITSLFLLLRAIFAKLESNATKTLEVTNFISKIKPALWKENPLTGAEDRNDILLKSEVISDSGNEILRNILEKGVTEADATDNYSINYNKFIELYTKKSGDDPMQIYNFIHCVLNYTIMLQIYADDQETALTIFNTLNDRGLPLSDADIFKSHIYKQLGEPQKKIFIQKWKQLEEDAKNAGETIQSLFYYHLFYLRALEGDEKSTTPGVRKYYLEKGKGRLKDSVIDKLIVNLHLWEVIKYRGAIDSETWSQNMDIRKILDCLSSYPNEFWKYPVSIFYMKHKDNDDFENLFLKFLRKFYVMVLTRYLEQPTISAVKGDILKLNAKIIKSSHPDFYAGFEQKALNDDPAIREEKRRTDNLLIAPNKKIERMLLKLLAYQEDSQTDLLPTYWEIEHIFPKKWDTKYYNLDEKQANIMLEHLGNKLPLEKRLNISASNGYFEKKKDKYKASGIAISKSLGNTTVTDWNLQSISDSDSAICKNIKNIFKQWVDDYEPKPATGGTGSKATSEELEKMRKLLEENGYEIKSPQ